MSPARRPRGVLAFPAVAALLAAPWAGAQALLDEDFEGPTLLRSDNPPGKWSDLSVFAPDASVALHPGAAYTGLGGLRVTDRDVDAGFGNSVGLSVNPDGGTSQYLRFRLRVSEPGSAPDFVGTMQVNAVGPPQGTLVYCHWDPGTAELQIGCMDRNSAGRGAGSRLKLPGSWMLVEAELTNLGSGQGTCRGWIDGALVVDAGVNLSGLTTLRPAVIGALWGSLGWTGVLDYDDAFFAAHRPQAALRLSAVATAPVGACTAVTLERLGPGMTALEPAPAPMPADLTLAGPPAQLFAEPSCSTPLSTFALDAGSAQGLFFLRGDSAGPVIVHAVATDSAPASTAVGIKALSSPDAGSNDGGTPDGGHSEPSNLAPRHLAVGCGCNGLAWSDGPLLFLTAWALGRVAARRHRRARGE